MSRLNPTLALLLVVLTAACAPLFPPKTPEPEAVEPAFTPTVPEPTPTPMPKAVTVCMLREPDTLMWIDASPATTAVLEAIADGSIDSRLYDYQPVIFETLPSFSNGDAARVEVKVEREQHVVDARTGQVVPLVRGVSLAQLEGEPVVYSGSGTATTVQVSASWTLVSGLTWHDGQPVTADDQVFMYETSRSPDLPTLKYLADRTASFMAVDDRTTTWIGLPGFDDPTYYLNVWRPLPRHAYGHLTPAQMLTDESVNRAPLGYGPFRFAKWVSGDHIRLEAARDTYWRSGEGLPRVDTLVFRFVDDPARVSAMLVSGECDLGTQEVPFDTQLDYLRRYETQGRVAIHTVPGPVVENLSFNIRPGPGHFGFASNVRAPNGDPIFSNPVVRRAFAYCLDRDALVETALGETAEPADAYLPPNHPLYPGPGEAELARYPFNRETGLELLASLGWRDHDGDGVLDRLGEDFSMRLAVRRNPVREVVSRLLQSQLREHCGIEVTVVDYGPEFLIADERGVVFGRQFDLAELAWPVGAAPPCTLFSSNQIPNATNDWTAANITGFTHQEFDEACAASVAEAGPASQAANHARALEIFTDQLPAIPLYVRYKIAVASDRLEGLVLDPTSASELWNVERFDVKR